MDSSITKTSVKPTDVFVVHCDRVIPQEQADYLKTKLSHELGGHVVIMSDGLRLSVMSSVPDMVNDIREFHRKFGIEYAGKPRMLDESLCMFRRKFLREELDEYCTATSLLLDNLEEDDRDPGEIVTHMEKALDSLVDLVYVALGTAHLHGFDFNEAWRRVHEANMKKIRAPDAEASKRATGRGHAADVIKPPGWEAPSHKDLIEDHAHR